MDEVLKCKMLGFGLRADNTVNNVATPTKRSNLTANGVVPICTKSVKDFTNATLNIKYKIQINTHTIKGIVEEIIMESKRKVSDFF